MDERVSFHSSLSKRWFFKNIVFKQENSIDGHLKKGFESRIPMGRRSGVISVIYLIPIGDKLRLELMTSRDYAPKVNNGYIVLGWNDNVINDGY